MRRGSGIRWHQGHVFSVAPCTRCVWPPTRSKMVLAACFVCYRGAAPPLTHPCQGSQCVFIRDGLGSCRQLCRWELPALGRSLHNNSSFGFSGPRIHKVVPLASYVYLLSFLKSRASIFRKSPYSARMKIVFHMQPAPLPLPDTGFSAPFTRQIQTPHTPNYAPITHQF